MSTYVLEPQSTSATEYEAGTADAILVVSSPIAGPGLNTSRMAYVQTPYQLEYFAYHQWADSPARMLAPTLRQRLDDSGLFDAVMATPAPVRADLRLDSELLRLQQVFDADNSEIQLAAHFRLIALAEPRLLASRTFSITEPCAENTPYAGVLAANEAVGRLLDELVAFIAKSLTDESFSQSTE